MIGITPRVQNVHRDLAVLGMHGVGHLAVLCRFPARCELSSERLYPASTVRRVTTRDDQANITSRTLGEVSRETVVFIAVFKACVHRAHEHPVFQRSETEVEWSEEVGVATNRHGR